MSKIVDHYDRLSSLYDDLHSFEKCYEQELVAAIAEDLSLTADDKLIDVGGGTGQFAGDLYKNCKLRNPIVCLDPSAEMTAKAAKREGVIAIHDNLRSGVIDKHIQFNKMLLKGSVHHIANRQQLWTELYDYFPMNSQGLIVIPVRDKELPFSESILQINATNPEPSPELFVNELESAGFKVENPKNRNFHVTVSKTQWYDMLRGRFKSTLRLLTDEEIECSIQETDQKYKDCEYLQFLDVFIFIKFAK